MKNKNIIEDLKVRYSLEADSYLTENVWSKKFTDADFTEGAVEHMKLVNLWQNKTQKGWYGISLHDRLPIVFYVVLDQFLQWVEENNPDFQILQLKTKFSNIRIYLDNINEQTKRYCFELEKVLSDKHLIY